MIPTTYFNSEGGPSRQREERGRCHCALFLRELNDHVRVYLCVRVRVYVSVRERASLHVSSR